MVFALLLLQDHKIVEHRYHESLSSCLKAKRYAMKDRNSKDRVVFKCIQSKANIEIYMGKINKIFNIRIMDKFFYSFFNLLDKFSTHLDNVFFPKKRKEKKV